MERKRSDLLDDRALDLDTLLHPSQLFEHPSDVISDPDLSLNEKRAILASWASDACAVEAAPALRKNPHGRLVAFDDIMDALRMLDRAASAALAVGDRPHVVRHRAMSGRGGGSGHGDQGSALH